MGAHRRIRRFLGVVRVLVGCGMLRPLRPDKYARQVLAIRRHGTSPLSGITLSAVADPDRVALVDDRGSVTYRELDARVDALAMGLRELGVRPGDAVGILCRNHRGVVESLAATSRLGADALLLNTGFAAPQLAEVVVREQARLVIHDQEFEGVIREGMAAATRVTAWSDQVAAGPTLDGLIERHRGDRPPRAATAGRVVLLTSGTTGTPKGARRSADGGVFALAAMFDRIPWRSHETVVVAAPAFHAFGFGQVAIAFTLGCTAVLTRRFDPEDTLRLVEHHRASGLAVVPVMIERICDLGESALAGADLSSLRFVTASGSRMRADAVISFMDRFGDVIYNSYNATEVGLVSTATPADLRAAPDTAGRPIDGTRVRLLDDDGRDVPPGSVGRIAVASRSMFSGYTNGETKDFVDEFALSGDTGRFDELGRLYVLGRDDDMIVSGGENVFPGEVERALQEHPEVREAAIVGVDDSRFGQRLAAYVVLARDARATEADLKNHIRSQLAAYKVPREIHFLPELPRNASGKVLTRQLAAAASREDNS